MKSEICTSSVTNYGVYTLGLVYFLINPYASEENKEKKRVEQILKRCLWSQNTLK